VRGAAAVDPRTGVVDAVLDADTPLNAALPKYCDRSEEDDEESAA
jgi:hypothetical protein